MGEQSTCVGFYSSVLQEPRPMQRKLQMAFFTLPCRVQRRHLSALCPYTNREEVDAAVAAVADRLWVHPTKEALLNTNICMRRL